MVLFLHGDKLRGGSMRAGNGRTFTALIGGACGLTLIQNDSAVNDSAVPFLAQSSRSLS